MNRVLKSILFVEFICLFLLPFLGYIGSGILNKGYVMLPLLGIAPLILFQFLAYAFWKNESEQQKGLGVFSVFISFAFITYSYLQSHQNFWLYVTEMSLLEVGAICFAFILFSFFGKNKQGRKMGEDVGYGIPILLGLIILGSFVEVFNAWKAHSQLLSHFNSIDSLLYIGSFAFDVLWIYPLLGKLARREIEVNDLSDTKYGMTIIISELIAWVIVVPTLLYFLGCFD